MLVFGVSSMNELSQAQSAIITVAVKYILILFILIQMLKLKTQIDAHRIDRLHGVG